MLHQCSALREDTFLPHRPFFLVLAAVARFYGVGVLPLGGHGWNVIGLTILVGAIVLCCLPEIIFGKYRVGRAEN